jgi:hypothetical protein
MLEQAKAWVKSQYWSRRDHRSASAGTADAGLPVVLASDGKLGATIIGAILTGLGTFNTAGYNLTLQGHSILNAIITGGGTITTAGYNLTLGGHTVINGGGFTLTIPATGTAALVSTGTWTPGIAFGGGTTGITYATQVGRWTRFSNIIHASCYVGLSNKGSSTGAATITGLPVAANSAANFYQTGVIRASNMSGLSGHIQGYLSPSGTVFNLDYLGTGSIANVTDTNFGNSSDIIFEITYEV